MAGIPITPDDVAEMKIGILPKEVIDSFNEAIAANFVDGRSSFTVMDVVERMVSKGLKQGDVYVKNWLNVELVYEEYGWKVELDRPGVDENYLTKFIFTPKKKPF